MQISINQKYKDSKHIFVNCISKLDSLSPLKTLTRGYAIVEKEKTVIKSINQLKNKDKIQLRLSDGVASAIVEKEN